MNARGITRRLLLAGAAAAGLRLPALASSRGYAVIDWGLLETMLAIGAAPVAATELLQYRRIVVEPAIPSAVADLGLRGMPNYELLRQIEPELILISNFYEYQRASLERIAPVFAQAVFAPGKPPYPLAEAAALALGERLDRRAGAAALIATAAREIARLREVLRPVTAQPLFIVSLGDARHFRAFGADALFGDVAERLGFANAWTDPTSYSAAAPVGIEALARVPDAAIVVIEPLPADVADGLPEDPLWNALPAVRAGRAVILPPINPFGGLPSALRFLRLFEQAAAGWSRNG